MDVISVLIMRRINMARVGDKFILHSADGKKYHIEVVNVSDYREPSMRYAVDVSDERGIYADDVVFVSDDLLSKCEKVNG